jgi:tetratricopeptide (TPR) repeat protein
MAVLAEIMRLERVGNWAEIRQRESVIVRECSVTPCARSFLSLALAYEYTATTQEDYSQALHWAQKAVATSQPGTATHLWALHMVASYCADMGLYVQAEKASSEFLRGAPLCPFVENALPWVYAAMGRVRQYQHRPSEAVKWYELAERSTSGELRERIRLLRVWALADAGHVSQASSNLPGQLHHVPASHLSAARARIAAAVGNWSEAEAHARLAIAGHDNGDWRIFDTIQAAELCLILRMAYVHLGRSVQSLSWLIKSTTLLACWGNAVLTRLVLMLQVKGGAIRYAAPPSHGAAGHVRCGLRGTVG